MKRIFKISFILILTMLLSNISYGMGCPAGEIIDSGDWSDSDSWCDGDIGGVDAGAENVDAGDSDIKIQDGETYTISSFTANNNGKIEIEDGGTLIITGDFVVNNNYEITIEDGGTLTIQGDLVINNGVELDIEGGVTVDGNVDIGTNAELDIDDSGSLGIGGTLTVGNNAELDNDGTITTVGCAAFGQNSDVLDGDGTFTAECCTEGSGTNICTDVITNDPPCDPCYSIASGSFGAAATWSATSGGAAETSIPVNDGTISYIIEGGFVVDVDADYNVDSIIVGLAGTGELEWSGNNDITFYDAAGLDVNANGTIDRNGNNDARLIFDQGSLSYALINDGTFDIGDIRVGGNETVTASGGSDITINDELRATGNNATFTNNNTGVVFINQDINANGSILAVNNNETIDLGSQIINADAGEVTFTQGANSNFILSGVGLPIDVDVNLSAAAAGNFVRYDAAGNQDVHTPSDNYFHLNIETSGVKESQGNLDVNGNLTISGSANLDINTNNNDITLQGNWISSSSNAFDGTNQTVTFDGISNQTIDASTEGTEVYYNMAINNGGFTVVMNNHVEVQNILDFPGAAGYLDINSNNLLMSNWVDGEITGYADDEFIIVDQTGFIQFTGVDDGEFLNIPMGLSASPTSYALADLTMTDAGGGTLDANLCGVLNDLGTCAGGTIVTDNAVDYTWNFVSTSTNANIKVHWDSSRELGIFNRDLCNVIHHNGTKWEHLSAEAAATSEGGTLYSRSGITTSFSPFAVSDNVVALPIELVKFEVNLQDDKTVLSWETTSEINNDYFVIERSINGIDFEELAKVEGEGNSSSNISYEYLDADAINGQAYYRLRQVDYDGNSEIFGIRAINNSDAITKDDEESHSMSAIVYPNPVINGSLVCLKFSKEIEEHQVLIVVVDVIGNQHYVKADYVCCDSYILNTGGLAKGIYHIVASQNDNLISTKLIVQ